MDQQALFASTVESNAQPTGNTKVCSRCHATKPLTAFHVSSCGVMGRAAACRDCCNEAGRKRRPAIGPKKCRRCGAEKDLRAFPKDSSRPDGRFPYCKLCHRAYQSSLAVANPQLAQERYQRALAKAREWRALHPQEYKAMVRRTSLLRRYGITPEQYGQKLAEQGGHCALCDRTPDMETHGVLHVDHDHACCGGKKACGNCFRALLCFAHNRLLGDAHDKPEVLRRAADFLEAWAKRYETVAAKEV